MITRYSPFIGYIKCPEPYWTECDIGENPSLFEDDLVTLTELGFMYKKNLDDTK